MSVREGDTGGADGGSDRTGADGGADGAENSAQTPPAPPERRSEGMWTWVAGRITGLAVFFYLFAHVLDTAMLRVSRESYDRVADLYKNPFANVLQVVLLGAVLFHTLNGLRVTAVDFWPRGARYQQQLVWAVGFVWIIVMVPVAFVMLARSATQLFGGE